MKQYYVFVKFEINRGGVNYEERTFGIYDSKAKALERAQLASELCRDCEVRITHKNWNTVKGTPIFKNGKEMV